MTMPDTDRAKDEKPSPAKSTEAGVAADTSQDTLQQPRQVAQDAKAPNCVDTDSLPEEFGGQAGPEPTRYGDWEKKGRCTDF